MIVWIRLPVRNTPWTFPACQATVEIHLGDGQLQMIACHKQALITQ
jgi:hypothetical protein